MSRRAKTVKFIGNVECREVIEYLRDEQDVDVLEMNCVQQGEKAEVLVSFTSQNRAEQIGALEDIYINGHFTVVVPVEMAKVFVKVFYLPCEVPNGELASALLEFGSVTKVRRDMHPSFPSIETGTRTATMTVKKAIPSYIFVSGFQVKLFHRNQKRTCKLCGQEGHMARACAEIQCYACKKYGHRARECGKVNCSRCGSTEHMEERCNAAHFEESTSEVNQDDQENKESATSEVVEQDNNEPQVENSDEDSIEQVKEVNNTEINFETNTSVTVVDVEMKGAVGGKREFERERILYSKKVKGDS